MRDKTHAEQIERWADYILKNPDKWREFHNKFIDSQILMARAFYKRLAETEEGRAILKRIEEQKKKRC